MQFNEVNSASTNLTKSYKYWVASSNFFETSLFFYPVYNSEFLKVEKSIAIQAQAHIYDCDGSLVNELNCSFDPNTVSVLEMSSFLEGLKYESGLKHGIIEIKTSANLDVQSRLISHSSTSLAGNLLEISKSQKAFLPLKVGDNINTMLVIANLSKEQNNIRSKLFVGKRSPEISIELPPSSVRVFSLANEYAECLESKSLALPGYLRVTSKNDLPFGLQTIELVEGNKDESVFSCIL